MGAAAPPPRAAEALATAGALRAARAPLWAARVADEAVSSQGRPRLAHGTASPSPQGYAWLRREAGRPGRLVLASSLSGARERRPCRASRDQHGWVDVALPRPYAGRAALQRRGAAPAAFAQDALRRKAVADAGASHGTWRTPLQARAAWRALRWSSGGWYRRWPASWQAGRAPLPARPELRGTHGARAPHAHQAVSGAVILHLRWEPPPLRAYALRVREARRSLAASCLWHETPRASASRARAAPLPAARRSPP